MIVSSNLRRSLAVKLGLLLGLCFLLPACGSTYQRYDEAFVRVGIHGDESAPEWVQGELPADNSSLYFVGRSVGYDVLDERGAFDAATAHVRQQLAEFITTKVSSEMHEYDLSDGVRYLPGPAEPGTAESLDQTLSESVCQYSEALVGDLVTVSQYWEQWDIREKPEKHLYPYDHRMRRYKLWVLMSIDKEALKARSQESLAAAANRRALESTNAQFAAYVEESQESYDHVSSQLEVAMGHLAVVGNELDKTSYERETLADLVRNGKRYGVQSHAGGCDSSCGGTNGNCRYFHVTGRPAVKVFNGPVGCATDIVKVNSQDAVVLTHTNKSVVIEQVVLPSKPCPSVD